MHISSTQQICNVNLFFSVTAVVLRLREYLKVLLKKGEEKQKGDKVRDLSLIQIEIIYPLNIFKQQFNSNRYSLVLSTIRVIKDKIQTVNSKWSNEIDFLKYPV